MAIEFQTKHKRVNSADMTSVADVSDAPESGKVLVVTDIIISVDTEMSVSLKEETSGTVKHGPYYLPANSVLQITPRGEASRLATADKKLQAIGSAVGNITVETWTYSAPA